MINTLEAWPVVDHLWRHESYQPPLLSDRISDLMSSRKTKTIINDFVLYRKHLHLFGLI